MNTAPEDKLTIRRLNKEESFHGSLDMSLAVNYKPRQYTKLRNLVDNPFIKIEQRCQMQEHSRLKTFPQRNLYTGSEGGICPAVNVRGYKNAGLVKTGKSVPHTQSEEDTQEIKYQ